MKGDFSILAGVAESPYSGVLHQQGRVLLDRDLNEAAAIAAAWQAGAARDAFGASMLAVPTGAAQAFKAIAAETDGTTVKLRLDAGRAWADGLRLTLTSPSTFAASYFAPPWQSPQASAATIAAGVRDLVVLDVWEESVNAFQDPRQLIEPALGGPDTTERTQSFATLKLLRLQAGEDCSAAARLADDFGVKGRLKVSPAPVLTITGDCPLEAGGGYTGLEHYLYRIEVADADAAGEARFKWSQWNGGLVGRGLFAAGAPGSGTLTITANAPMINHCGVASFHLEALRLDTTLGAWTIALAADATLASNGVLALANIQGAWPAAPGASAFFRLWNGIARVADYPPGAPDPVELKDGIRLEFEAPAPGNVNYAPGDYWTFPVRAAGAGFEPPQWPTAAPPLGVAHHRVALGILNWNGPPPAAISFAAGQIDDCRHVFRPLTQQMLCCSVTVGDGRTSHGDFDSIEEALRHVPALGGDICLLPGLHLSNAVIAGRRNLRIKGCDMRTLLMPRPSGSTLPVLSVGAGENVRLEHLNIVTLGGTAIAVDGVVEGGAVDVEIAHCRIVAYAHAVAVRHARGLNLHHNRIRMIDKAGGDVAFDVAADDSLIERNDIALIPAPAMPPLDLPGQTGTIDPNDPCADFDAVFAHPALFARYVDLLFTLWPKLAAALLQPYRAAGGIRIGGGSERVRVLDNHVAGGAGNGITLGSVTPPAPPPPEQEEFRFTLPQASRVVGKVFTPEGQPLPGVQITLTDVATGKSASYISDAKAQFAFGSNAASYRVTESEPGLAIAAVELLRMPGTDDSVYRLNIRTRADDVATPPESGFLYDIAIERNEIEAMGLSGIGAAFEPVVGKASALQLARSLLGTPVVGLQISDNRIAGCLLNPFDNELRETAMRRGLGGIALGLCERTTIAGNRIEGNGGRAHRPACGVYVAYGEELEIAHNRIADNAAMTPDVSAQDLIPGRRGGIVIQLVSSFNLLDASALVRGELFDRRAALRLHGNAIDQPVGLALYAVAFGPVQCVDNSLASDWSGLSPIERFAGNVFLFDLGGIHQAEAGKQLQRTRSLDAADAGASAAAAAMDADAAAAKAPPRYHAAPAALLLQRDSAVRSLLPGGALMFSNNQSSTGALNTSAACHAIATLDDLAYQDNQTASLRDTALFANGLLVGNTLRVTGNRMSERGEATLMSLLTLGVRLNNTSLNQGDHCIIASDMNPAMDEVKAGNQMLNVNALCANRAIVAAVLFKPQG